MKFIGFDICNFKGIEKISLNLQPAGANVFTLIGLNESGKTTILEAINQHSLHNLDALYGDSGDKRSVEELSKLVPKSEQSDFSDDILITAKLVFEDGEKAKVIAAVEKQCGCKIEPNSIPAQPTLTRRYKFADSDYKSFQNFYNFHAFYKTARAKKFRRTENDSAVWRALTEEMRQVTPTIAYFPTFLFNQPERIYLTPHDEETPANALYRTIIENIGADLPKPLDVQRHLVERLINEKTWAEGVFSLLGLTRSKQQ